MVKNGRYVLYAEDNLNDCIFFSRAFSSLVPNYELIHRENGGQIRDYLTDALHRQQPLPRLVVLDNKMPGLSGLDVLEFIRDTPELNYLPVVLLSGSTENRDINRAYAHRVNAYLVKPDRYQQLKQLIESIGTFWLRHNRVVV